MLDLTAGPVVVQVPDFGDRFWVYQVCDQRTDGYGKTPDGITAVFRCPTDRGVVIPRVFQTDEPQDKQAVQPLINQVAVYPLSDYDGKMKITEWSKLPTTPPDPNQGAGETKWVKPETFFDAKGELPPVKGLLATHFV